MNKSKLARRAFGVICFLCSCFIAPTLHGQEPLIIRDTTITDTQVHDRHAAVVIGPNVTLTSSGSLDITTGNAAIIGPFTVLAGGQMQLITVDSVGRATLSPAQASFTSELLEDTFILSNPGKPGLPMDWGIASSASWVKFEPVSGTVDPGDSVTINVTLEPSILAAAYYTAQLEITTNLGDVTYAIFFEYDKEEAFASPFPLSYGEETNNYRIISVPGDLKDPSPESVLAALGEKDIKQWRLFDTDGVENNREFPNTPDLLRGKGLFLLVRDKNKKIDLADVTIHGDTTFTTNLQRGWNLIGNPFNRTLLLANNVVDLITSGGPNFLAEVEEFGSLEWKKTATMEPWQGYALYVEDGGSLVYHPYRSGQTTTQKQAKWHIQISASSGNLRDEDNFAGVHEEASLKNDAIDRFEPPVIGRYISLHFPHLEWSTFSKKLSADYQPTDQDGWTWEFAVESSGAEKAELTFTGFEDVPAEYRIVFVDPATNIQRDVRVDPAQTIATLGEGKAKMFKLIVGPEAFVTAETAGTETLPESFFLHQNYPNPFNPVTSIRFDLPEEAEVSLKIFDVLGREVVQLIQGTPFAGGRHSVVWDARNARGNRVSSGLYFYVLEAGAVRQVRKMTLLQ